MLLEHADVHRHRRLVPAKSGWFLGQAEGINNSGQIVVQGLHEREYHALLLKPTHNVGHAVFALK
jgi:hypothetical protein